MLWYQTFKSHIHKSYNFYFFLLFFCTQWMSLLCLIDCRNFFFFSPFYSLIFFFIFFLLSRNRITKATSQFSMRSLVTMRFLSPWRMNWRNYKWSKKYISHVTFNMTCMPSVYNICVCVCFERILIGIQAIVWMKEKKNI